MTRLQFYDNARPSLAAGSYTIVVEHAVTGVGATLPDIRQELVVEGPRFTIDPADIHAVFPPPNANGPFGETLPHVVMNKRTLPWERRLGDTVHAATPWLALLLFEEGELRPGDPGVATRSKTMPVRNLLAIADAIVPSIADLRDADRDASCQVIRISGTTFASLIPKPRVAAYLAHCRETHTDDKASFDLKDDGWFLSLIHI